MTTIRRNRVDLHCHTRRSDGILEPADLYAAMRAWGLRLAAITDHDTLEGYRELRAAGIGAAGTHHGPRLIPALEINTVGNVGMEEHGLGRVHGELHILGFGVDADDPSLDATLDRQRRSRETRIDLTLAVLRDLGMRVDDEFASLSLPPTTSRGRPHVGEALVLAGYASSIQDAFDRWLSWGRPAYVPRQGIGPRDALDAIVGAGGIAVLAHSPTAPEHPEDVARLQGWGLSGIEVYYRGFDHATVERMIDFAARNGLVATGGSDFHGQDVAYRDLAGRTWVPDAVGDGLLQALGEARLMSSRALPMLELAPAPARERVPIADAIDARLTEFLTDDQVLPRFHVWTLGCQMNHSDSEEMAGALLAAGCAEADGLESADLVVINSCAIREAAEHKVIGRMGALSKLKAANPALRVVLTGCSVRADETVDLRRRYPAVDLFLRPDQEPELAARLGLGTATSAAAMPDPTTLQRVGRSVAATADRLPGTRAAAVEEGTILRRGGTHAWLPVIYGCDKTCTYCIVPFSRGPERSRPFDDVIAEARALAAAGVLDVTLLGQNVNSYGHDLAPDARFGDVHAARTIGRDLPLDGRPDMAALLRAIDGIRDEHDRPAIPRLRFVTSHPWDLSTRLIDAIASCASVCEHLHLPVQAGDDAVLHRMGRQYTVEAYLDLVGRLRAAVPGIALTTDVIVGFCGETDAQFQHTLQLLRTVRYDAVFAAAFSPRPGTPASRLADDVPAAVKRERLNALLDIQEGIGHERNDAWVGQTVEVLVDQVRPPRSHDHDTADGVPAARVAGRTRHNKLVHLDGGPDLVGRFVSVAIDHAGPYALTGQRVGGDA